jgi:hypothetical protein
MYSIWDIFWISLMSTTAYDLTKAGASFGVVALDVGILLAIMIFGNVVYCSYEYLKEKCLSDR